MNGKNGDNRKQSAQRKARNIPDNDSLDTDDRGTRPDREHAGRRPLDTQSEHPDAANPGERGWDDDQRTRGSGETGEDEDLPDNGGTETDRGNIVRSPRNFDDSAS